MPDVEIFPAFNYARDTHDVDIVLPKHEPGNLQSKTVVFTSTVKEHHADMDFQLDVTIDRGGEDKCMPTVEFTKVTKEGLLSPGVVSHIELTEGQAVSFIFRDHKDDHVTPQITTEVIDKQQHDTQSYWFNWISKSKYKGRWREIVSRSLLILKLLTFEPTGAIVAAPTFSIPEAIKGERCVPRLIPSMTTTDDYTEIGITDIVGSAIPVSQSIFFYEWALLKRQMPTWISSVKDSENRGYLMEHYRSCLPSMENMISQNLS